MNGHEVYPDTHVPTDVPRDRPRRVFIHPGVAVLRVVEIGPGEMRVIQSWPWFIPSPVGGWAQVKEATF